MIKTFLTIFVTAFMIRASGLSESLFIEGHACELRGQDDSACYFYGLACKEDTGSLTLQVLYSNELIKIGNRVVAAQVLKKIGSIYAGRNDWLNAFITFKKVYDMTKSYEDGSMFALMLYRTGVEAKDQASILKAEKVWNILYRDASISESADTSQILRIKSMALPQ